MLICDCSSYLCSSDLEVKRPCMNLMRIGITTLRKSAYQVERGRCLIVGADHALRIGLTPCLIESDVVDDVAAIARQFLAADLFRCGGARLRELPGHTPHLHDGKLRRIGQHHRHLRSEEPTSELQSLMRNPYAVFCL